jgi:hypothetical protein
LSAACLFVAGALRALVPAQEFTVAWMHSVEKTRWEERYRVERAKLRLVEARIQGSGAGMDPPADATFDHGWWSWRPSVAPLSVLRLTLSPFTRDYDLCWRGRCQTLRSLVASAPSGSTRNAGEPRNADGVVEIRACRDGHQ